MELERAWIWLALLGVSVLGDVISDVDVDVLHAFMKYRLAHVMLACNVVLRDLGRYHGVTILEFLIESGADTLYIAVSFISAVVLDVDCCVGETQAIGPLSQEMTTQE